MVKLVLGIFGGYADHKLSAGAAKRYSLEREKEFATADSPQNNFA